MESFANKELVFPFKKIRVIPFQCWSGAVNMTLDYFFASTITREQNPILRFFAWKPYCLSLGYHQDREDVDVDLLKEEGYGLVRRPTGGSAIFHANELTYSLIVPLANSNHQNVYQYFHSVLEKALNQLGYAVTLSQNLQSENYLNKGGRTFACFNRSAYSEIQYKDKKVVGSAQKLFPNSILQHGSIIIGTEHEQIVVFLQESKANKEKYLKLLQEKSISLSQISNRKITVTQISEALVGQFSKDNQIQTYYQYVTEEELDKSHDFNKYVQI